jgi:hypothetical protein
MLNPRLAVLVLATVAPAMLAPAVASAQTFAYTPGTQRYRIEISVQNQRDQNGGRAPAEFDYSTTQYVTVHLTRQSPDTLGLSVTIDSVGVESSMDAPKPDLSWEKGATLNGTISPSGHLYTFAAPTSADGNMRGLYDGFKYFLPALQSSIAAGKSWADTSRQRTGKRGSFDSVSTQRIITSRVTGDTTYAGQRAWRIERSGSLSLSGQGSEGGRGLRVAGDGTIRGVQFVSVAGVYLGSRVTQIMRLVESFEGTGDGPASTQTIKSEIQPVPPVRTANVTGVR